MLTVFNEKFGTGTDIAVFGENGSNARAGARQQPEGFTKPQVLATALDPRTKHLYGIPSAEHATAHRLVISQAVAMKRESDKCIAQLRTVAVPAESGSLPLEDTTLDTPIDDSFLGSVEREMKKQRTTTATYTPVIDQDAAYKSIAELELREFTSENMIISSADPLEWWRSRMHKYPLLAAVARTVLAVPATSADAERLFSEAGSVKTANRNRLTGDSVTLLVWLKQAWKPIEAFYRRVRGQE